MSTSIQAEILLLAPPDVDGGEVCAVVRDWPRAAAPRSGIALARVPPDTAIGAVLHATVEDIVELSSQIEPELAILVPRLATALSAWSRLGLELGEAAVIVADDVALARWLSLVAAWFGGMPVIASTTMSPDLAVLPSGRLCSGSSDGLVGSIRQSTADSAGWAGIETTGRPDMLEVMLEAVPKWGRIALGGQNSGSATVDFYNNVHRKGVHILSATLSTAALFDTSIDSHVRHFVGRAAGILSHPLLASQCRDVAARPPA